ncbi:MAG: OmpA family protein [Tidjanibacter sp.]|nr:OmpA family protein [Tidjanibacter sp.]
MRTTKLSIFAMIGAAFLMVGCSTMSNTGKGALLGTGAGTALGAGLGALIGGDKGALVGAAAGAAVGAGAGAAIGKKMDKKAEELAKQLSETATIETVTDANNLQAIKVTFEGGILFDTNKSDLSATSKTALKKFVESMSDMSDTDITIYGHTDNTGSLAVNERLSLERANSVASYLRALGVNSARIIDVQGKAYNEPVASNDTAEGRAQNRRVELFVTANQNMIQAANAGSLQ